MRVKKGKSFKIRKGESAKCIKGIIIFGEPKDELLDEIFELICGEDNEWTNHT